MLADQINREGGLSAADDAVLVRRSPTFGQLHAASYWTGSAGSFPRLGPRALGGSRGNLLLDSPPGGDITLGS